MEKGGKNARGKQCIFPFIYKNRTYTKCTYNNAASDEPWCSTKVDESNNNHINGGGHWGICLNNCSIEGKLKFYYT